MKNLFLIIIIFGAQARGQWLEHLVNDSALSPSKLVTADMNNNGLIDIVVLQRGNQAIYWYENEGDGTFGSPRLVGGNIQNLRDLTVGDLTGDGNTDVVATSYNVTNPGLNLFWFKHLDGNGNFGFRRFIVEVENTISRGIVLGDIDNDGFLDIVVSSNPAGLNRAIVWYRNLGNDTFAPGQVIVSNFSNGTGIAVGDIDGDGYLDVISGTGNTGTMSWFKNLDGEGNFGEPIPIGSVGYNVLRLYLVDIDNDGDLDVIGSSINAQVLAWWENLDGEGTYSIERVISTEPTSVIFPADIDNDGDLDLLAMGQGFLRWYENLDGLGTFGETNIISDNLPSAVTIEAADINGNGYLDAITASQTNQTVLWYENNLLTVEEYNHGFFVLFPNPVGDVLQIEATIVLDKIVVYDTLGRELFTKQFDKEETTVDVSYLSSGTYYVEFVSSFYREIQKLIKK